jgi:hypothetical protein
VGNPNQCIYIKDIIMRPVFERADHREDKDLAIVTCKEIRAIEKELDRLYNLVDNLQPEVGWSLPKKARTEFVERGITDV